MSDSAATLRPEAARLREVIDQAVEQFCFLAEEREAAGDHETADRIRAVASEYLEDLSG